MEEVHFLNPERETEHFKGPFRIPSRSSGILYPLSAVVEWSKVACRPRL